MKIFPHSGQVKVFPGFPAKGLRLLWGLTAVVSPAGDTATFPGGGTGVFKDVLFSPVLTWSKVLVPPFEFLASPVRIKMPIDYFKFYNLTMFYQNIN